MRNTSHTCHDKWSVSCVQQLNSLCVCVYFVFIFQKKKKEEEEA